MWGARRARRQPTGVRAQLTKKGRAGAASFKAIESVLVNMDDSVRPPGGRAFAGRRSAPVTRARRLWAADAGVEPVRRA